MRSSLRSQILLIVIATILATPVLLIPFQNMKRLARFHNRTLNRMPTGALFLQSPDSYFHDFELWLNDRIGFNEQAVDAFKKFIFYIFRDSPSPNVSVHGEFVFLNAHSPNAKSRFNAFRMTCPKPTEYFQIRARLEANVRSIARAVQAKGVRPIFVIAPSKPALYPEQLPLSVPETIRERCFALHGDKNPLVQLSKRLPDLVVYPFMESLALRYTKQFYPPGNFHFKGMSAHTLSKVFFEKLGRVDDRIRKVVPTLRVLESDLTIIGFRRPVEMWDFDYSPYGVRRIWPRAKVVVQNQFFPVEEIKRWYPRLQDFSFWLTEKPITGKTALLFSNSFGAFAAPHLARGYKKLLHINLNDAAPDRIEPLFEALVARYKPDELIFVFHDTQYIAAKLGKLAAALR